MLLHNSRLGMALLLRYCAAAANCGLRVLALV
jgi:hypothetical protein